MSAFISKRDKAIGALEKTLRANPDDLRTLQKLLTILDWHLPEIRGLGAFTECQRILSAEFQGEGWLDDVLISQNVIEYYKKWQTMLDLSGISSKLPIGQLFVGQFQKIGGVVARCDLMLSLFKKQGVISKLCYDCYKVQILPLDLIGLMRVYFILRKLRLPRDNARKCMIELREDVAYPYKGYIYCESEEEAKSFLELFRQTLREFRIPNVHCGISHGCSEYGLEYPEFKYSDDGAHRSFGRPESWDRMEAEFWAQIQEPVSARKDNNKEGVSIRDVIGFRTWIDYAELIGDNSWKAFRGKPSTAKPAKFMERVGNQSQLRKAQREELRGRMASAG
ncbi:MAG: hypothetical protein JSU82_05095 [Rhodospirillales bacterium]|nr:MAG: hypothetical protein JSU82_05095 [Rhodospirillales bacterium]